MPRKCPGRYIREESLGYHTSRVSKIILKRLGARFAERGVPIRTEEFPFLSYLWGNDGRSQKDLAEAKQPPKRYLRTKRGSEMV